ncbi:MAG TPA: DUF4282 domain-containing protein [Streptosporangiaceae bacterium]|nr:DUF4282 domain-containing protein [Streptosporangiaceae bacterium]
MTDPGYGQAQPYGAAPGQGAASPGGQGAAYPGGQGAAYPGSGMPFPSQGAPDTKGFMASLFDTSFSSFVTPKVIKVVYIIIMVILGIVTLGYVIFGFVAFHALGIIFVPVALLVGLVYLAITRMGFELVMVIFRMGDDMHALRTNNR